MNVEKIINNELNSINNCISKATEQYVSQSLEGNNIAPDYHVLMILATNIKARGITYQTDNIDKDIFEEAVQNFKSSVESFTNENVHIVTTVKEIKEQIVTKDNRNYLVYWDIYPYLQSYSAVGLYDAVLVASKEGIMSGGATTANMFVYENIMFGFSHLEIVSSYDASRIKQNYSKNYPYLKTTNYMIHEWLHQLSGYQTVLNKAGLINKVIYPDVDQYNSTQYSWNKQYFNNASKYPNIVESNLTSYYRAILCAEVTYTQGNVSHLIGVFPSFWNITPRKIIIGRYIVQGSSNNKYSYNNSGTLDTSKELSNDMKYIWNIYYSFDDSNLKITNFSTSGNLNLPFSMTDYIFTRVGPYDEGEYILVNATKNNDLLNKLLEYNSNFTLSMNNYQGSNSKSFSAESYSELYYTLAATDSNIKKYLDLNNAQGKDGNTVSLNNLTGYPAAQTWQFRFDGQSYKIMPLASSSCSLSFYDSSLHITEKNNIQTWRPELVANGKYIYPGKYKIKTASGNYLTYNKDKNNNYNLILSSEDKATEWQISKFEDNYYKIYIGSSSKLYFDVENANDADVPVKLVVATGYNDAQTWKFMLQNDGSVIIVPRLSLTRGILSTSTSSKLSISPTLFKLVKV